MHFEPILENGRELQLFFIDDEAHNYVLAYDRADAVAQYKDVIGAEYLSNWDELDVQLVERESKIWERQFFDDDHVPLGTLVDLLQDHLATQEMKRGFIFMSDV